MKADKVEEFVRFAKDLGHVFIATADSRGMPHIAAAGRLDCTGEQSITVREWFCPGTVSNLNVNKHVSIVAWRKEPDTGYQLLGTVIKTQDAGVLDGYAPEVEQAHPMPQIEKEILIEVENIIEFKLAPHSDLED